MSRKNRKYTPIMSVKTARAMNFGAVIVVLAVMVIINLGAKSGCEKLVVSIRNKEREYNRLEEDRVRAIARWDEMTTPDRLDKALRAHGLNMKYPRADQQVRMTREGVPYRDQLSMKVAKKRGSEQRRTARR